MRFLKALIVLALAIGFVAAASLLRPAITGALDPKRKKKKDEEAAKKVEEQKKKFPLQFGFDQTRPRIEVTLPRRRTVSETVSAPGSVTPISEVSVGSPFAGTVLALAVDEGHKVKKGDLVFALDPREYQEAVDEARFTQKLREAAVEEARLELADARARLAERTSKKEAPEVREARLSLRRTQISRQQATARLETAQSTVKRSRMLYEKGLSTEAEVENAQSELRVSKLQRAIAEEDLEISRQSLELKIDVAERELREFNKAVSLAEQRLRRARIDRDLAKITLERAEYDLERTKVLSPINGLVTLRNINSGETINRNDSSTVATSHYLISDFSKMYIYADVDEGDVVKVAPEQSVKVRVNALGDDIELAGKVVDVGNRAAKDGETLYFRVRILVTDPPPSLRPGMTANVDIETQRADDALILPVQAIGQRRRRDLPKELLASLPPGKGSEVFDVAFVVENDKARYRILELGISDGEQVEVVKGVDKDAEVVSGPYRELENLQHDDAVQIVDREGGRGGKDKDDGKGLEDDDEDDEPRGRRRRRNLDDDEGSAKR